MPRVALGCALAVLLGAAPRSATAEEETAPAPERVDETAPPPPPEPPPPVEPVPLSLGPDPLQTDGPWRPPAHVPGEKDWLRLTSGEWVRGKIELITEDTVYFDSDELDDLEIDWDTVASLRSPRLNTYRFAGRVIVTGTAGMRDGVMRIDTGSEIHEFRQFDLFGMIEGGLREIDYWSLELGVGLTLRAGNADQRDASGRLEVKRETPLTRALVSYHSAYSVVDSEEIANNQRLLAQLALYVSKRFFVLVPVAEAYRDRFQNIDLRATVGTGLGYDLLDRPQAEWNVAFGGAYQRTEFDAAEAGEARTADDAALLFGSRVELEPHADVEWDTSYRLNFVVTDVDKTNHRLESVLSFEFFGPVDLDVTFVWDRIEGPQPDASGEIPESDDVRLTVGLAIDL